MMKFFLGCLALACTILCFGLLGLVCWGIITLIEAALFAFPLVGVVLAVIVFFGWMGWILWLGLRVVWIFVTSFYETFCEKFIK